MDPGTQSLIEKAIPGLKDYTSTKFSDYCPNGIRHVDSRRFGAIEVANCISSGIFPIVSVVVEQVIATFPNKSGTELKLDHPYTTFSADKNTLALPRIRVGFQITEPFDICLPDINCAFAEFRNSENRHLALLRIIEEYGWQAGLLAISILPNYSKLDECFTILKNFLNSTESREYLGGMPSTRGIEGYNTLLPYDIGDKSSIMKNWEEMQFIEDEALLDKRFFRVALNVLSYLNGGEEWNQDYGISARQMNPVTVRGGMIYLVLRSQEEERLIHDDSLPKRKLARNNYIPIPDNWSPNPVTYYLFEPVLDASTARMYNYRRHYCFPPRRIDSNHEV